MSNQKPKKKKRLIIIVAVEIFLLLVLLAGILIYNKINKTINDIPRYDEEDKKIVKNEGVEIEGYKNIVIFGVDTRDNSLKRGNTDTIMIASINNKTKDVKLVSIYRDTYVDIPDIGYRKINAAYANGGYSLAISTINQNFDLDIEDYVTVNFKAVIALIDELGGITLDIKKNELKTLNGYVRELNRINDTNVAGLKSAGTQTVNGTQATAYARIRYTSGGDFKRTERQRIVISKIFEKVKSSDLKTINGLIDKFLPQIYTNMTNKEILGLAKDIFSYDIVEQTGFPFEKEAKNYKKISYVFPINLKDNVVSLHKLLFENESYSPSAKVIETSDYIEKIRNE
jgi:LCP family protein required for cell wall assembly